MHNIMSMHACSTTQKVLKCTQDSERPEVCLIDVDLTHSLGRQARLDSQQKNMQKNASNHSSFKQWMNKSFTMVDRRRRVDNSQEGLASIKGNEKTRDRHHLNHMPELGVGWQDNEEHGDKNGNR